MLRAFALLSLVVAATGFAQAQEQVDAGILRIKVTEDLAQYLESTLMTTDANNIVHTGIQAIDANNLTYRVRSLKRVFRPAGEFEARHRRHGLHLWYELRMDDSAPVLEAVQAYGAIGQVEIAEPSYKKRIIGSENPAFGPVYVPERKAQPDGPLAGPANDPMLGDQWHYENTGQADGTPGSDISLFQAWSLETGSPDVVVAVTDGGAQVDHPDLEAHMWINEDEIPDNDIDDDNNGYVDDINGYGFGDNTGGIAPDDHGTHVSGTVAAVTNNGIGVAGVAGGTGAGDGARIMSLAAFGATGTGGFAETYVYGADNGAVISQNSWGYTLPGVFEQVVLDGIDYFIAEAGKDENGIQVGPMNGGIVIFAAGNSDSDDQWYPGFYDPTLAVGGLTNQDKKAWYSNFGAWVDISAPGGETFVANDPHGVLSTVAGDQYAFFQGTSMACPHVSGAAALIISKFGGSGFTPEMLRGRLTQLVDDVDAADPAFAGLLGTGRLNAFKALQADDGNAPEAITDLAASGVGITHVTLTWTSPVDSANGSASVYDLRYATSPITEANFSTATPVDVPAPSPAGTTESFTVSGLQGGVTYYFAIKSADFFGNFSSLSNVVEQATNFPPVVSVDPPALEANLETAETTSLTLNISNDGLGELTFAFDSLEASIFATPAPASGSVPAGSTLGVSVLIDANNLLAGTYHQNLLLSNNDPEAPYLTIPVTLNVTNNDAPIASVTPTSLSYGPVFVTDSVTQFATIHNAGSDTLTILSVSSTNSDYSASASGIMVAPFEDFAMAVTFSPAALGSSTGTLSISTDDPAHAVLEVTLDGEGVPAPELQVSPASLSSSLNTGRSEVQQLTLSNTGGSDLQFSIEVDASTTSVATTMTIELPVATAPQHGAAQKGTAIVDHGPQVEVRSVGTSSAVAQVLIVSPDVNVTDLEVILDAFEDINADIYPQLSLPSISLSDLLPYDVVLTTNNTQWLGAGGVDPGVIGDLLADYIDAGGKVISNQFAYSYDAWRMEGRFIDEQYGPFTPSTSDAVVDVELGTVHAPGHPVFEGVSTLLYSGFVQNVGLAPAATAIASWSNGELFIAANANVVALNMLPSLGNGGSLQWTGDLPLIFQNAVHYLSGPGFVSVAPAEGTIAAGGTLSLDVTFDATGLDSAMYESSIRIATNVPTQPEVLVPATLHVLGPEFTVNPTALAEALEKDQTSTRTIVLNNNGPDDQTFSVNVEGVGIGVSAMTMSTAQPFAMATLMAGDGLGTRPTVNRNAAANLAGTAAMTDGRGAIGEAMAFSRFATSPPVAQASTDQYATDFDNFTAGDVDGQEGWIGLFGNWTIQQENAYSAPQHFRGLSDGLGQSLAFSPVVPIGGNEKSTTSMKLNVAGSGVTWQIIPQSPSAELVATRIQFDPAGGMSALIPDGAGGAIFDPIGTTPSGYFDLTIEADRDSAYFEVFINGNAVYTGQGFAGDIEQVVVLSLMEVAGPTLDMDDFRIIDGEKEGVSFVNVSPSTGTISAGTSVALNVTFDSNDLPFGTHNANIDISIGGTTLSVPASLRVFGDPQIEVDPTVLNVTVDYRAETTETLTITNTGGNPLEFSMTVVGADTEEAAVGQHQERVIDDQTREKIAEDQRESRPIEQQPTAVQLLTGVSLFTEAFEGGVFPPSGWSVVDNAGTGLVWDFAASHDEDNYAGTGEVATVSSDAAGTVEFDTELITPEIPTAGFKNIAIQYNANYQNFINLDFLDLDIQVDGGPWTNVLRWNEDHGTLFGTGELVTVELGSFIGDGAGFRLRWHYYDPNDGDWDWYAQIDDLTVYGDPRAWLSVSPASGTIPVNGSMTVQARFDAEDVEAGTYGAGIFVVSNAGEDPFSFVFAQLNVREPAAISVAPESLHQELLKGEMEMATQTLTITNNGASTLKFGFGNTPAPASLPVDLSPTEPRTERNDANIALDGTRALISDAVESFGVPVLTTGFEEFAIGDINGQNGWAGQFGNWRVEAENPYEGLNHIRSVSDGLGGTLAFSPTLAVGTDPISSATFVVDPEPTVTWQLIPQSPTAGFVNTRIQFGVDGALSVLVQDSLGNGAFVPVPMALPEGYFDVRVDVERATSQFTLYIDGDQVFTGQGFAGDIEQIVLFSNMEVSGPIWDIDNIIVYDGQPEAPWLTLSPRSGEVPPGGTMDITVAFNSTDIEVGTYFDSLYISNNDPANPLVSIPVTLDVLFNTPPVLDPIDTTTVIELGETEATFTATDIDDEPVEVVLANMPAFISSVSSGDGTATYRITPGLGDGGAYDLLVTATDARGKQDSAFFHLRVVPYGVESFALMNASTGETITTFTDTLDIDLGTPHLRELTVRANTNPPTVGSVKFVLDNRRINTDNSSPYDLARHTLRRRVYDGDDHVLEATAFTKAKGRGNAGKALTAVVRLVNKATITDFDVMALNGSFLADLHDGMNIDHTQPNWHWINIRANTEGGVVRSVVFKLNGHLFRIDNYAPYHLGGIGTFIDLPLPAVPGEYELTATPYSEPAGRGIAGQALTVAFTIGEDRGTVAARSPATSDDTEDAESLNPEEAPLSVYPVPARDVLHVELHETREAFVVFKLINAQGLVVHSDEGQAGKFQQYRVDIHELGLRRGIYYIQFQYADGYQRTRKIMIE